MIISWIEQLKGIIGEAAYQSLCEELPGKGFTIPKTATPNHFLSAAIGIEKANQLCNEMSGVYINLPISAAKRKMVLDDLKAGNKVCDIANKYYVTRRYVEKMRRHLERETSKKMQRELF